jgi:adenylate cyclase
LRHWLKGLLVAVLVGIFGSVFALTPAGTGFEQGFGLQWLFKMRGNVPPPTEVAVVAINSDTGRRLGLAKMPSEWPRDIHVPVLNRLVDLGAAVIVFDMDFNRAKHPESDRLFADAVARSNRVVLFERIIGKRQPIVDSRGQRSGWYWTEEQLPPLEMIAAGARGTAPFPLPKIDARLSQFWTFKASAYDAPTLPATALQLLAMPAYEHWRELLLAAGATNLQSLPRSAAQISTADTLRQVLGQTRRAYRKDPSLAERVEQLLRVSPADSQAHFRLLQALNGLYAGEDSRFVNFYGVAGTIPTISYQGLRDATWELEGEEPHDLSGKVVFIGYSDLYDPDQPDRFNTAFTRDDGVDLSGVEIAATTLGNLLQRRAIAVPSNAALGALPFAFGALATFAVFTFPALISVPVVLMSAAVYGLGVQYLFNEYNQWLPISIPLILQLPFALLVGLLAQYLVERAQKQRAGEAVSYYLPESVAKDLLSKGGTAVNFNKVVYGACFATDMAGFSTLAETLSPQELADFMNDYFEALAEPLRHRQVGVTEFRADAIMCAWTAEQRSSEVHLQSALAALEAREAIREFNLRRGVAPMTIRVGLDVGWVYVGHAGGGGHFVYSIVGDTANTASRVEGLNKLLGTELLATGDVVERLSELLIRPVGRFIFVGKRVATPIVELVAQTDRANERQVELCRRFAEAMESFGRRQWVEAERFFQDLLDQFPGDGPATFYRNLCRRYQQGEAPAQDPTAVILTSK